MTNSIRNVAETLAGNKIKSSTYSKSQIQAQNNISHGTDIKEWEMMGITREEYIEFKRSGMIRNEWIRKNINKIGKNPSIALLLSFFIPGAGQYYNGDITRGIIQEISLITCIIVIPFSIGQSDEYRVREDGSKQLMGEEFNVLAYLSWGAAAGIWVWSWLDARNSSIKHNKELLDRLNISLVPSYDTYSKKPMIGMNIQF